MVRPIISGISRLSATMGTQPLDAEEKDSGTMAFAALMYQSGGMLDARTLVALWLAGVTMPRVVAYAEGAAERKRRRELEARGLAVPVAVPTPKVGV